MRALCRLLAVLAVIDPVKEEAAGVIAAIQVNPLMTVALHVVQPCIYLLVRLHTTRWESKTSAGSGLGMNTLQ